MQLLRVLTNIGCARGLFVLGILCFETFGGSFLGGLRDWWILCANCL